MFTKIRTAAHRETLCAECARMLDAGGISRQIPDWGEDVITPDMVRERTPAPGATRCTWCGPESRWLSERMIARLPAYRRSNLERRIREKIADAAMKMPPSGWGTPPAWARRVLDRYTKMLGRLSALTA